MMLYWIQAKVTMKVFGISGPFIQVITKMVNANSTESAKVKYEAHIRNMFTHVGAETYEFEYLIIADTI